MGLLFRTILAVSLPLAPAAAAAAQDSPGFGRLPDAASVEVPLPPPPAPAARAGGECAPVAGVGCFYSGAPAGAAAPLLIYYRGWLSETNYPGGGLSGGHIGGADLLRSARAALSFYGLKRLADEKRLAVLVTGSSDIGVTRADLDRLAAQLGAAFTSVSVAAHSGGYAGLSKSLDSFGRLEKMILLDPFYSDFSAKVAAQVGRGAACGGFYTRHNAARYKQFFSGSGCAAEPRTSPGDHEYYVPSSLKKAFD